MTREKRNERFGFGGSKRGRKRDDGDVGDLEAFDRRGRGAMRGRGGGRGGGGARGRGGIRKGGPQRPGKQRRMKQMK
jgi:rRNA-processing protein EBP2